MYKAVFYIVMLSISLVSMYKFKLEKEEIFQTLVVMILLLLFLECIMFFEKFNNNG